MTDESEETLIWRGTPSQWTNFGVYFFCLVLIAAIGAAYWFYFAATVGPIALTALAVPLLWMFARWLGTRFHVYEITSERIKITRGLLSRHTTELELYRVRDYSLIEPFWLRLVGCGNILLATSDRTTPQVMLRAVPRANTLKDQIRAHTERMRQRRGVRDLEIDTQ